MMFTSQQVTPLVVTQEQERTRDADAGVGYRDVEMSLRRTGHSDGLLDLRGMGDIARGHAHVTSRNVTPEFLGCLLEHFSAARAAIVTTDPDSKNARAIALPMPVPLAVTST
jgi:hypothetical protein